MLRHFVSFVARRSLIRRPAFVCSFSDVSAASGADRRPSDEFPAFGRLSTAIVATAAAAVSGVGMLMLSRSYEPSTVSFAESGSRDLDHWFANQTAAQGRKPGFLLSDSYRKRVFFSYEKRIRLLSPPEKIFKYFASFRNPKGEVFMLPTDLMRAIVPVFPPSESNIVREGYLRGEQKPGELHCASSSFFMLFDTDGDGLISFPEYIFLVTLLSIPESSFTAAFKMFDIDNNGFIKRNEFEKMMAMLRIHSRQGSSHKNGLRIGLKVGSQKENVSLMQYLFGKNGNECLQHDKFIQFLRDLHDEIIRLEFAHYDFSSRGTISAKDFAFSLVASAEYNHINKLLDRADELNGIEHLKNIRISFEEFKAFAELRRKLKDLAFALLTFEEANGLLTKQDFQQTASHVCGFAVSDNVVEVVFHIFDTNGDGKLSPEEFLSVLQKKETYIRQLNVPPVQRLLQNWWRSSPAGNLNASQ